jgi:hypothetical protein
VFREAPLERARRQRRGPAKLVVVFPDSEDYERAKRAAASSERSLAGLTRYLLREYTERWEKQEAGATEDPGS